MGFCDLPVLNNGVSWLTLKKVVKRYLYKLCIFIKEEAFEAFQNELRLNGNYRTIQTQEISIVVIRTIYEGDQCILQYW